MKKQYLLASSVSHEEILERIEAYEMLDKINSQNNGVTTMLGIIARMLRAILDDEDPQGRW